MQLLDELLDQWWVTNLGISGDVLDRLTESQTGLVRFDLVMASPMDPLSGPLWGQLLDPALPPELQKAALMG